MIKPKEKKKTDKTMPDQLNNNTSSLDTWTHPKIKKCIPTLQCHLLNNIKPPPHPPTGALASLSAAARVPTLFKQPHQFTHSISNSKFSFTFNKNI